MGSVMLRESAGCLCFGDGEQALTRCACVSDLDDSEAEDERDLVLGGEDIENDSDADLDALLEDANRLVGRPASTGRKRAKTGKGRHMARGSAADDEEEGEGAEYMYDDFWGPSGKTQTSRKRGKASVCQVLFAAQH